MKTQGQLLQTFYTNYCKNNKSLTKRSFALYTGVDPARMHDYMADTRVMTPKIAQQICRRLKINAEPAQRFLQAVESQRSRKKKKMDVLRLSASEFSKVSDWHYFAILALLDTVDFESDPDWFAQRLSLSKIQAREALNRLVEVGLVKYQDGQYGLLFTEVETETDISSADLRKAHKQSLQRVLAGIDHTDVSERYLESVIFAGDPQKLKLAKRMISQMAQKVVALFESGKRTDVFEINIQLMPVTRKAKEKSIQKIRLTP
jgi:uncharacterized protein (TIGR02147 family)